MGEATHDFFPEKRDRLKLALNEKVQNPCDFERASFEYLFRENINESYMTIYIDDIIVIRETYEECLIGTIKTINCF